jgi:hypothetical protein
MVVNSVLTSLSPSYGLRPGDNPQTAKPVALAKDPRERSFTAAVDAARSASTPNSNAADVGHVHSTLGRAPQQAETAAESLSGETSESPGSRSAPGIALYQRISQYDNSKPSTSTLLKSWNEIMQGGQDTESAAAALAKTLSQDETLGFESGILDITA